MLVKLLSTMNATSDSTHFSFIGQVVNDKTRFKIESINIKREVNLPGNFFIIDLPNVKPGDLKEQKNALSELDDALGKYYTIVQYAASEHFPWMRYVPTGTPSMYGNFSNSYAASPAGDEATSHLNLHDNPQGRL